MTGETLKQIIQALETAYPSKLTSEQRRNRAAAFWQRYKGVPDAVMIIATQNYIKAGKFFPKFTELDEKIKRAELIASTSGPAVPAIEPGTDPEFKALWEWIEPRLGRYL